MEIYIVDAFTAQRFSGNQAGTALLAPGEDFPPEALMTALAGELKHSETAYIKESAPGSFHIRYFTPAGEVDLCGHATVAAFTVLRETGRAQPGTCALKTAAGDLAIRLEPDCVWMDMAPPRELRAFSPEEAAELYGAYGLTAADAPEGLLPALVSTGLADIMLPVRDRAALGRAVQDRGAVIALSRRYEAVGVHMFCPDGAHTARCRNFAPLYGIDEEAATGTSNGALTYYLYRRGMGTSDGCYTFLQGEEMGKPSLIRTRLTETDGAAKIQMGGTAVIALRAALV